MGVDAMSQYFQYGSPFLSITSCVGIPKAFISLIVELWVGAMLEVKALVGPGSFHNIHCLLFSVNIPPSGEKLAFLAPVEQTS